MANKTGIYFRIFMLLFLENCLYMMQFMIFQYCLEPVIIQRIFIGFEAILKNYSVLVVGCLCVEVK